MYILGFDIGGTKCAVITAEVDGDKIQLLKKEVLPTDLSVSPYVMLERLICSADGILEKKPDAVGISCGGPLDIKEGLILSPPNLPGWDKVKIVKKLRQHYGCEVKLQNDANACAVAEWNFGAGKGTENMIFLTFGTGIGAGLILGGRLYTGTNGNAGEIGHVRLEKDGPVGYGKKGSFEGFCSGGGISQLGYSLALERLRKGSCPLYFNESMTQKDVTAKNIAAAAKNGDETALEVFRICGEGLGKGLSVLVDVLNPEAIVLGGIFPRCKELLLPHMEKVLEEEALPFSLERCKIVPAFLGENIGDYGAVSAILM